MEVTEYENLDLEEIVTPVKVKVLADMLQHAGYNPTETKYLVVGFTNGFSLEYSGPRKIKRFSNNLPLRVGNQTEL